MAQKTSIETTTLNHDEKLEGEAEQVERSFLTPAQLQHRFDTLRDLDDEQMAELNKRVVKKIDWRLMPCITIMFLMKYAPESMTSRPSN